MEDCDTPQRNDRGLPDVLQLLAPVLGGGVCVALDVKRPDRSPDAQRSGVYSGGVRSAQGAR